MLNRVILIGRLTKDPELRYTPAGVAVTQFTLAVARNFTNQQTKEKEADFINIVAWRQLAETCANYLRKGRLTAVEGRLQVRNYDNNEGRKVYVTEVIADNVQFLESSKEGGSSSNSNNSGNMGNREESTYSRNNSGGGTPRDNHNQDPFLDDGKPIDISDDDLPF
ncbi:MAG: single-stranded DNA-binding protein [Paenibacillaceae bacterium]